MLEIKSTKITEKGQICIPKDLRNLGDFKVGSKVSIFVYKDKMELRPMKRVNQIATAIASERSLAKDWLSPEEDEAWKDL